MVAIEPSLQPESAQRLHAEWPTLTPFSYDKDDEAQTASRKLFKQLDRDGNGYLSQGEIRRAHEVMLNTCTVSLEDAAWTRFNDVLPQLLCHADGNSDGKVDAVEWQELTRSIYEIGGRSHFLAMSESWSLHLHLLASQGPRPKGRRSNPRVEAADAELCLHSNTEDASGARPSSGVTRPIIRDNTGMHHVKSAALPPLAVQGTTAGIESKSAGMRRHSEPFLTEKQRRLLQERDPEMNIGVVSFAASRQRSSDGQNSSKHEAPSVPAVVTSKQTDMELRKAADRKMPTQSATKLPSMRQDPSTSSQVPIQSAAKLPSTRQDPSPSSQVTTQSAAKLPSMRQDLSPSSPASGEAAADVKLDNPANDDADIDLKLDSSQAASPSAGRVPLQIETSPTELERNVVTAIEELQNDSSSVVKNADNDALVRCNTNEEIEASLASWTLETIAAPTTATNAAATKIQATHRGKKARNELSSCGNSGVQPRYEEPSTTIDEVYEVQTMQHGQVSGVLAGMDFVEVYAEAMRTGLGPRFANLLQQHSSGGECASIGGTIARDDGIELEDQGGDSHVQQDSFTVGELAHLCVVMSSKPASTDRDLQEELASVQQICRSMNLRDITFEDDFRLSFGLFKRIIAALVSFTRIDIENQLSHLSWVKTGRFQMTETLTSIVLEQCFLKRSSPGRSIMQTAINASDFARMCALANLVDNDELRGIAYPKLALLFSATLRHFPELLAARQKALAVALGQIDHNKRMQSKNAAPQSPILRDRRHSAPGLNTGSVDQRRSPGSLNRRPSHDASEISLRNSKRTMQGCCEISILMQELFVAMPKGLYESPLVMVLDMIETSKAASAAKEEADISFGGVATSPVGDFKGRCLGGTDDGDVEFGAAKTTPVGRWGRSLEDRGQRPRGSSKTPSGAASVERNSQANPGNASARNRSGSAVRR